jgi:hypothetical protein
MKWEGHPARVPFVLEMFLEAGDLRSGDKLGLNQGPPVAG